jgi:hypothetical protein
MAEETFASNAFYGALVQVDGDLIPCSIVDKLGQINLSPSWQA